MSCILAIHTTDDQVIELQVLGHDQTWFHADHDAHRSIFIEKLTLVDDGNEIVSFDLGGFPISGHEEGEWTISPHEIREWDIEAATQDSSEAPKYDLEYLMTRDEFGKKITPLSFTWDYKKKALVGERPRRRISSEKLQSVLLGAFDKMHEAIDDLDPDEATKEICDQVVAMMQQEIEDLWQALDDAAESKEDSWSAPQGDGSRAAEH